MGKPAFSPDRQGRSTNRSDGRGAVRTRSQEMVLRAQIILLAAQGPANNEISKMLYAVSTWRPTTSNPGPSSGQLDSGPSREAHSRRRTLLVLSLVFAFVLKRPFKVVL